MAVFFQILQLARLADRTKLVHWALVQTMANQSRVVNQKAGANGYYWGNMVSPSTCLRKQKEQTENLLSLPA